MTTGDPRERRRERAHAIASSLGPCFTGDAQLPHVKLCDAICAALAENEAETWIAAANIVGAKLAWRSDEVRVLRRELIETFEARAAGGKP